MKNVKTLKHRLHFFFLNREIYRFIYDFITYLINILVQFLKHELLPGHKRMFK